MVALLLALLPARVSEAQAPLSETGRWSQKHLLGLANDPNFGPSVGTHVAALKGPGDTTRVFMFGESGSSQKMRVWSFVPSNGLVYPQPDPQILLPPNNFHGVVRPAQDLFCSGHAALANGRLLIVGGQYRPEVGTEMPFEFNPLYASPTDATSVWKQREGTARGRWYPTVTALADGKLLATSGTKYAYLWTFGGDDGSLQYDLRPLALGYTVDWPIASAAGSPAARKDHTAIMDDKNSLYSLKRMVVFGGEIAAGQKSDQVWGQYLNPDDSTSHWSQFTTYSDPGGAGTPVARSRHSAIYYDGDAPYPSMVVYGGRDQSGNALGDVWKLQLVQDLSNTGTWIRHLSSSGSDQENTGPGNRYGHTAIFDPGLNGTQPRMLVFGGRTSPTNLAPNTVWALNLSGTPQWTKINPNADPQYGSPTKRDGHSAVGDLYDQLQGQTQKFRMVMFGGHDGAVPLAETWSLWHNRFDPNSSVYSWQKTVPPQGLSDPPARTRHAVSYDRLWDRMVLFGGESQAGLRNDLWTLDLTDITANTLRWSQPVLRVPPNQALPNLPPTARAGHTAVADPRAIIEWVPERFDPDFTSQPPRPLQPGAWETLGEAAQSQLPYPFMTLLPSGHLLWAGPEQGTRVLRLDQLPLWVDTATPGTYNYAGSAVMYRPGSVLRCGTYGADGFGTVTNTDTIRFSGTNDLSSGWQPVAVSFEQQLYRRKYHNLTMLPTGDVLVTGGLLDDDLLHAEKHPQIWRPLTGSWQDHALLEDPAVRNYHSAAILLPDARVLSTGGEFAKIGGLNTDRDKATIFEPHYLFNSDGSYASRPVVVGAPCQVGYGSEFFIRTSSVEEAGAIANGGTVCLVRPGAVTHGFNQDQRYVPLQVYACGSSDPGQQPFRSG